MNLFEKVIYFLQATMNTPKPYGLFHIVCITLLILFTYFSSLKLRNKSDKTIRKIILFIWIIMFTLEIYKQIIMSFDYKNNIATWEYPWYIFPYQLCSTPLYLLPIVALSKNSKFRDSIISFLCTYSLLGGLATYIVPSSVFSSFIGINIQTMIHHGLQISLGVLLSVYYKNKLNNSFFIKGIYVFMITTSLAIILNLLVPTFTSKEFNMFYLSPYYSFKIPLLNIETSNIPYPLYLFTYLSLLTIASLIIFKIQYRLMHKGVTTNE